MQSWSWQAKSGVWQNCKSWLSRLCIAGRTRVIEPHFTQADSFTKQEACLACFTPLAAGPQRIPDRSHVQVARLADQARRLQGQLQHFLPSQVPIQQQQTKGHPEAAPAKDSMQAQLHPNSLAM